MQFCFVDNILNDWKLFLLGLRIHDKMGCGKVIGSTKTFSKMWDLFNYLGIVSIREFFVTPTLYRKIESKWGSVTIVIAKHFLLYITFTVSRNKKMKWRIEYKN